MGEQDFGATGAELHPWTGAGFSQFALTASIFHKLAHEPGLDPAWG